MPSDLVAPEKKWKRIRSPFDLNRHELQHGSTATGTGPLQVTTCGKPWHYAAVFRYRLPHAAFFHYELPWLDRSCRNTKFAVVRVRARVERGEVGIGVTNDKHEYIDETIRRASEGEHSFDILIPDLSLAKFLVVRDGPEPGGPSSVVIESIRVFRLPELNLHCDLTPPPGLKLAAAGNWSRFYGDHWTSLAEKIRALRYNLLTGPAVMGWLDNLRVEIYPKNEMSQALYISGLYEPTDALVISRMLKRGGVFFDLGANIGLFSLLAARQVGPQGAVHAFEPSSREFGRLTRNISLNRLGGVIHAERVAVSDHAGTAELRVAEERHAGHNTLAERFAYDGVATAAVESVSLLSLDDYVRSHGLQRVDVIKMDVEGNEGRVLSGAREVLRTFRPRIVFEANESALKRSGSSIAEVADNLGNAGYELRAIDDDSAELLPLSNLECESSRNLVALPREAA